MKVAFRVGIAASLAAASLLGWSAYEAFSPNPNDIDPARVAPQHSAEGEESARYLASFPFADYKIVAVNEQGRFYLDDIDDMIKRLLRKGMLWEPWLVPVISAHVRTGSTVIDAGAHIGVHTIMMARLAGRKGRVYAFEPQRKLHRELFHNLQLNGLGNAVALRFALGDRPGTVEMHKVAAGNEGGTAVGHGGEKAELRTIDSFGFRNVSFIKIDVEGYEDYVLAGAERTIREQHPVLLIEIQGGSDHDKPDPKLRERIERTIATLKSFGYSVKRVSGHDYLATHAVQ